MEITIVTNIDNGHDCVLGIYESYKYARSKHTNNNDTFTTGTVDSINNDSIKNRVEEDEI